MIQTILTHLGTLRDGPLKRRRLLTVLAPLTLLGLVICICMGPAPVDEDVYLLIDSQETYTVTADSDLDYQSDALYTGSNNAGAADVQLILPKGQEVQLTAVEEGTSAAVKNSGTEVTLLSASLGGAAAVDAVDSGVGAARGATVGRRRRGRPGRGRAGSPPRPAGPRGTGGPAAGCRQYRPRRGT